MGAIEVPSVRDRRANLAGSQSDVHTALAWAMAALHSAVRFKHGAAMVVDPRTLLPTAGLVEGLSPESCDAFWHAEFQGFAFNRFADLARASDPVATLLESAGTDAHQAQDYFEIFAPPRFEDELRIAFVSGGTCRGWAHLLRAEAFTAEELTAVRPLSRPIAEAFRHAPAHRPEPGTGSAIVILDADDQIVHATVEARDTLDEIRAHPPFDLVHGDDVPARVEGLLAAARADSQGTPVHTRVRGVSGAWFRVVAVRTESAGHVALTVEPARPADLIPIALETFALTPREINVVECLARGLPDKEIATELWLSQNTVRDHVKSVLAKCGATSRGDLVARIFYEHVKPSLTREVRH